MNQQTQSARDFSTISPSAKWILMMKGHTDIPFAKQAAEIVDEKFKPDMESRDLGFWGRTYHFESRYRSIDQLWQDKPVSNILELSSGFSFRGLERIRQGDVYYIDTDLPDMVTTKQALIAQLEATAPPRKGTYELQALNALDEDRFWELVDHFPEGPVGIINEGLLMYLDNKEKEKLCGIIRDVLKKRGGYWITADIYIKIEGRGIDLALDAEAKKFFDEHRVEENKFNSFDEAKAFFGRMGFQIEKELVPDPVQMSSFGHFIRSATPEQLQKMKGMERVHTTWRLGVI